ncbi:hypothetical protein Tel_14380 [Candidatus Tenderia electrophaga]|jgi:glucokinase|uniref:Glucokinase n=1 Tax=Candidatus Tenderia electrophaga TaxID=1748243 RepID=A0A0S2TGD9_9GAMM|nr:hypothetical protein Tel_14380 [Candidatus Tenderia electrophaga]
MQLLCGDIGGTKTLLQHVVVAANRVEVLTEQRFPSADYPSFDLILEQFLSQHDASGVAAACFGVAGPVVHTDSGHTAAITNLPWQMDSAGLARRFKLPRVALINDFEAVGHGIDALPESDFVSLQGGEPLAQGNRLVVGAGTGLGVAQMVWGEGGYRVMPSEGGHADFAPGDTMQLKLAEHIMRKHGRCSVEFVLSGPGLMNIFTALAEMKQLLDSLDYQRIRQAADPAAAIATAADQDSASLAGAAMALFVKIYGGQCGNYALACLPRGGVFVAGGIAAKIIQQLRQGDFMAAFNAKGKMAQLMQRMPVNVITNPGVGLIGTRVYAERLATD